MMYIFRTKINKEYEIIHIYILLIEMIVMH